MDTATCGRFKLALEFKLFAVGVSVSGPVLLFFVFCLTILIQRSICL